MGFLGISGKRWKQIGKIALKAAPIVAAPFTGGASLLALGAGTGALSGALGGGGWKGALMGAGLGAIPGGGAGGAVAGGAAKVGLKEIAKGVGKGALTNFATGTGTGLVTGQGLKQSLAGGGQSALSGIGTTGGAGGFGQAAKTVGKNVALGAGGAYASRGLQAAGVPGGLAAQGGNVFTNYLGNQFTSPTSAGAGSSSLVQQPAAKKPGIGSYLPQTGGNWQQTLANAGVGAVQGAQQGGGWKGALSGATQGATGVATPTGGGPVTPGFGLQPNQAAPTTGGTAPAGAGGGAQDQGGAGTASGFWGKYGPLIAQGGGLAVGALVGKKATEMAQQRSPEELAALTGAQGAAGQAGQLGGQLAKSGQQYQQGPANYFQTLLSGNRAAMSQMVAPAVAQITGNYRGAERGLEHAGIRGAQRDVAAGELNRQKVSQIAGLTTGVQPYAAEQLAKMGEGNIAQAGGLYGQSGNIYGNLLQQGANNRTYARKEGGETAAAIGGLARDVGEVIGKKGAPGATTPKTPKKTTVPKGKSVPVGGQTPTDILGGSTGSSVGGLGPAPPAPLPVGGQTPGQILAGSPGSSIGPLGQGGAGTAQVPTPFSIGNVSFGGGTQPRRDWF